MNGKGELRVAIAAFPDDSTSLNCRRRFGEFAVAVAANSFLVKVLCSVQCTVLHMLSIVLCQHAAGLVVTPNLSAYADDMGCGLNGMNEIWDCIFRLFIYNLIGPLDST